MKKHIPNFITLLNLFFGCMAILAAFQSGTMFSLEENGGVIIEIPVSIFYASLYIGIAALMDFLDGFAARIFKVSSEMGKQLDSLADVVSFGVAPAIIVFQFLKLSLANDINAFNHNSIWLYGAFIIPMAGAYRLARFNIDKEQTTYFKGVPIPMIGLLTAAFPLIYWQGNTLFQAHFLRNVYFWYVFIFIVATLMVIKVPMLSLKALGNKKNLVFPLLIVIFEIAISAYFYKWMAIPFGFIGYCLVSLFYKKTITQ
jgi:CDP-diacylglycerol--serine O-phosphatidyltransferase